jgi:hypothetical protein
MDPNEQATTAEPAAPGFGWMDYAGIIAAGLLAVILVDIWTGGALISRRLARGGGQWWT